MHINLPLPPHLDQFVRDQLTNGHFQSEGDVVRAALLLLEDTSRSRKRFSDDPLSGNDAGRHTPAMRRSPRGILADCQSRISPEEIKEARAEMWYGFPTGEA